MLQAIDINGFRKYEKFSIDGFGNINFILGSNNVGKTSILEAIFAWACGQNIYSFMNIPLARARYANIKNPYWVMEELLATVNKRHNLPLVMSFNGKYNDKFEEFKHTIFPSDLLTEYDSSYKKYFEKKTPRSNDVSIVDVSQLMGAIPNIVQMPPVLIAKWEVNYNGKTFSTDVTVPQIQMVGIKPFKQAKYIDILSHIDVSENVQMYASLKREKLLNDVVEDIGKVFPEIDGFDMIPYPDGSQAPVSVIKKDGNVLPLYACGDGIQKWFYIFGALAVYKNSIICIDEIDSGFHPKAQASFCKNMVKNALKNGVQLFVTTHNIEFVDNFIDSISELEKINYEGIRIITVRDAENEFQMRNISVEEAKNGREEYNLELR